jgi:hypothetical protein
MAMKSPYMFWILSGMGMNILLNIFRYCQPDHIAQLASDSESAFLTVEMLRGNEGTLLKEILPPSDTYSPSLDVCDIYVNPWGR